MFALLLSIACYSDPPDNLAADDPGSCVYYVEELLGYGPDALGCHISIAAYPDTPHCCPVDLYPVCINRDGGSICSDPDIGAGGGGDTGAL